MGTRGRSGEKKARSDIKTARAKSKKEFTRSKGERAVVHATSSNRLEELQKHKNKHVVAKATYKLAHIGTVEEAMSVIAEIELQKPKIKRAPKKKETK